MACMQCARAQTITAPIDEYDDTHLAQATYVRVGNANVLLSSCKEHLEQLMGKELVFYTPNAEEVF